MIVKNYAFCIIACSNWLQTLHLNLLQIRFINCQILSFPFLDSCKVNLHPFVPSSFGAFVDVSRLKFDLIPSLTITTGSLSFFLVLCWWPKKLAILPWMGVWCSTAVFSCVGFESGYSSSGMKWFGWNKAPLLESTFLSRLHIMRIVGIGFRGMVRSVITP